jgi:hypothetical protein
MTGDKYDRIMVLEAKMKLLNAAQHVRLAQIKALTNNGARYYGKRTEWLRERLDNLREHESAVGRQIEETRNGN